MDICGLTLQLYIIYLSICLSVYLTMYIYLYLSI